MVVDRRGKWSETFFLETTQTLIRVGKRVKGEEIENFEMWRKTYDDPEMKEILSQLASYTYDGKYDLRDI